MLKKYLENRNVRIGLWIAGIVIVVLFMWLTAPRAFDHIPFANENAAIAPLGGESAPENKPVVVPAKNPNANTNTKIVGFTEKKIPHLVSSNIANNATLTSDPATLTLTFDSTLIKSTDSFITIKRDQIYSATKATSYIGVTGKTLSVNINPQVMNGAYYVYYVACFADTGCKDGRFGYNLKTPQ